MRRHIPNILTVLRIVLALTGACALWFSYAWPQDSYGMNWLGDAETVARSLAAFGATAFLLAAISDWLDGYLARRWSVQSRLGALLDPIADKLLVDAYLVVYTLILEVPVELAVPVAAMVVRDLAITLARTGKPDATTLTVSAAAKLKTALAMIVTALPLIAVPAGLAGSGTVLAIWIGGVWIVAAMSLATGLSYLRR